MMTVLAVAGYVVLVPVLAVALWFVITTLVPGPESSGKGYHGHRGPDGADDPADGGP
ncbi:hypothetical protein [Corynebacterium sp.]|uniref:hypothetical protein n=1 Tax=Corynebacterium sp. TaxID=1720 RepID=UPI0026DDA3F3|nr:hypothetical protein [Corynebacterium sp.]MDO4610341.1 hypothetical protein [Corynebacterium sp.]